MPKQTDAEKAYNTRAKPCHFCDGNGIVDEHTSDPVYVNGRYDLIAKLAKLEQVLDSLHGETTKGGSCDGPEAESD